MEICSSGGVHSHIFFDSCPYVGHRGRLDVCMAVQTSLKIWEIVYLICLSTKFAISLIEKLISPGKNVFISLYLWLFSVSIQFLLNKNHKLNRMVKQKSSLSYREIKYHSS